MNASFDEQSYSSIHSKAKRNNEDVPPIYTKPFLGGSKRGNDYDYYELTQSALPCSKLTIETPEQGVKYV